MKPLLTAALLLIPTLVQAGDLRQMVYEVYLNGKRTHYMVLGEPTDRQMCEAMAPMVMVMATRKTKADNPDVQFETITPTSRRVTIGRQTAMAYWKCVAP